MNNELIVIDFVSKDVIIEKSVLDGESDNADAIAKMLKFFDDLDEEELTIRVRKFKRT
jgi:hypothetical protein